MVHVLQSRVLLAPRDLDGSIDFYEDRLGLVRYRDWGERPHRGVVYFLGGGYLELNEGGDSVTPKGFRLWLQVGDIHAAADELRTKGVVLASEPKLEPWGLIECTVVDPDGVELVLVETPVTHPLRRREPSR
ncbi:MAG: VOC family protein [Actinobacteria bacterium]|nr:VOC family protein [Actinomycetota bacterium]